MGHSTELNKGERRKEGLINDYKMIQEIMESKDITWEDTGVIYTDGSKKKNTGKSIYHRAAFIFEEEDKDFYLNMNKRSSIFTAEVVAIAKAIQKYEGKDTKKKIIF